MPNASHLKVKIITSAQQYFMAWRYDDLWLLFLFIRDK